MSPYHLFVRLVGANITETLWWVQVFDGKTWEHSHSTPLPREQAHARAQWLTDVLCHTEAEFEKRIEGDRR